MQLLIGVIVSGIALGLLYGILGFAIVFLYRTTGLVNFAAGNVGMFGAFLVYEIQHDSSWPFGVDVLAGLGLSGVFGGVVYLLVIRPYDNRGTFNLVVRTLALYLLLAAFVDYVWGSGEPFGFSSLLPMGEVTIAQTQIAWSDLTMIGITACLAVVSVWLFRSTKLGLQFLAIADDYWVARLLGVRVRLLTGVAWIVVAILSSFAAILVAPSQLLSSDMMSTVLLYSFAGVVVGGLTSMGGAVIGGLIMGIVSNVVTTYAGANLALVASFVTILVLLLVRPAGLFGDREVKRV